MANILLVSSELAGVAPIGGIAEYVLGLASSLQIAGHDVKIALPRYGFIMRNMAHNLNTEYEDLVVWPGMVHEHRSRVDSFSIENLTNSKRSIPVLLIGEHEHFDGVGKPGDVYQGAGQGPDAWETFTRSVVDYLHMTQNVWMPDVIHCQDGHTSMTPVYINQMRLQNIKFACHCRTVLTIHNLLFQGRGYPDRWWHCGLPDYTYGSLFECNGESNAFKAGLYSADAISTVSYSYADEICSRGDVGFGLEGVLNELRCRAKLRGIVNAINECRWQIEDLPYYRAETPTEIKKQREKLLEVKRQARRELMRELWWPDWDLNMPVISMRSRWDDQKGFYQFVEALEDEDGSIEGRILEFGRVILVTWGTPNLDIPVPDDHPNPVPEHRSRHAWGKLLDLANRRPDRIKVNPPCLEGMANLERQYLTSDFLVIPSRYEPCGLIQMECQRYGTIPIVRRTGGLADTVAECQTLAYPSPNGFTFDTLHWGDIVYTVRRAVDKYIKFCEGEDDYLGWVIDNTLLQQNGWDVRIPQYEALYGI